MVATRVSVPAGRRLGTTITLILLFLMMLRPMKGADIVATITGVLSGGYDQIPIFGVGTKLPGNAGFDIKGQPFTLIFTFDDAKGRPTTNTCANSGSGMDGGGTAVLTIAGVSHSFGNGRGSSGAWRQVSGQCTSSLIMFHVNEAVKFFDFAPSVDVRIQPGRGGRSLTQNPDWKAPLSVTGMDNQTSCFFIGHSGGAREAKGCFDIQKLEIVKR